MQPRQPGIKPHTFAEYVARLVEQAQVWTQLTSTRTPRVTRGVNVSELQFDDNEPNPYAYRTNVHEFPHDFDTTVDDIMGNYSVSNK
jgi:hypothetical protein